MSTYTQPVSLFQKIIGFPFVRLVIGMAWMFGAAIVPSFIISIEIDDTLTWPAALFGLTVFLLVQLLAYYLFVRIIERRPVTELSPSGAIFELAEGIGIGILLLSAVISILWVLGYYQITGLNGFSALVLPFTIAVVSGVSEEIRYRAIGFRIIEGWLGSWLALLISALYFGISHISNPNGTLYTSLMIALEGGILLAAAYMLTRRLWLVIGLHMAWNFSQAGIFGIAVSGHQMRGVLQSTLSGPQLLAGGDFGAEASIFALILCLLLAAAFLWRVHQRGGFVKPFWNRSQPTTTEAGSSFVNDELSTV